MSARRLAAAPDAELLAAVAAMDAAVNPPPPIDTAALTTAAYDWRALTVKQPWTAAIVHGPKNIENRTQQTHRRVPVLIHAGQSTDRDAAGRNPALARWLRPTADASLLVSGAIVGVAQIVDCHPAAPWWRGGCCAPWGESGPASESAWHWVLTGRRALREPVPARGALGFWRPPGDVLAAVLDQLGSTP